MLAALIPLFLKIASYKQQIPANIFLSEFSLFSQTQVSTERCNTNLKICTTEA